MIHVILRQDEDPEGKTTASCGTVAEALLKAAELMTEAQNRREGTNIEVRNVRRGQTVATFTFYRGDWG